MKRFLLVALMLTAVAAAQGFDPYKKQVVDYGVEKDFPGNPHHDQLTCFYYRGLVVKQLTNRWIKGSLFLSFLRFDKAPPACLKEHPPDEKIISNSEWVGYFRGMVKGDLVFFDSEDGQDGGMPFALYDSKTQKKIFEENAYYASMWNPKLRPRPSLFNDIRVRTANDGNVVLTYLRVIRTECDIPNKEDKCWPPLVQKLGLKTAAVPSCIRWEENQTSGPSAVAYPVETSLFPTPVMETISGPVRCWPAD
ncbi:MAG TPA: hypothetical protein VMT67_13930 [Terriglobales bacterium]|nr:hypothetical protein [Terriglobales bacterium]